MTDKLYHCAAETSHAYTNTEGRTISVYSDELATLCGHPITRGMWDFPSSFLRYAEATKKYNVCPKCWNHPDLPLLILGDL